MHPCQQCQAPARGKLCWRCGRKQRERLRGLERNVLSVLRNAVQEGAPKWWYAANAEQAYDACKNGDEDFLIWQAENAKQWREHSKHWRHS
jgi:hypothetical protein